MMTLIRNRKLGLLLCAVVLAGGCAGGSHRHAAQTVAPAQLVVEDEVALGNTHFAMVMQNSGGPIRADLELSAYVDGVGQTLAALSERPELPWSFVVTNSPIPNSWSLPGGKVALSRGLLVPLSNESELAYLLAHEIVHVAQRHSLIAMEQGALVNAGSARMGAAIYDRGMSALVPGVSTLGLALANHPYGADEELAADAKAMTLMVEAGYDPMPMLKMLKVFVRLSEASWQDWNDGLFHIHPPTRERVVACERLLAGSSPSGQLKAAEFQQNLALLQQRQPAYDAYGDGVLALMAGDVDKAIRLANRAIAGAPEVADFYGLKGIAQLRLQRYAEAEAAFSAAVQRDPDHYRYLLLRGLVRKGLGNIDAATNDLLASTELRPTRLGHQVLGALYLEHNQGDLAWRHFMRATGGQIDLAGLTETPGS